MHDINYLKKELIEGINGYMKITRRDVEGDYSEMVGGASYRNGLSNATWDTRFNSIGIYLEKNCEKFNLLYIKMDRGRRRTQSPALGIESSESGCVPWVWLESVIRCVSQAVRSTSQDLVNYEGTFPLGLEFILFLVRQA